LLKLEFAVCTPKRASYLLGCLGIYIRHHRQQEVDATVLEKNPWNVETNQQARTPLNAAPTRNEPFTAPLPKVPQLYISTGL